MNNEQGVAADFGFQCNDQSSGDGGKHHEALQRDILAHVDAKLDAMDRRLLIVEGVDDKYLPQFLRALRRLSALEKVVKLQAEAMRAVEARATTMENMLATNTGKLDDILSAVTKAAGAWAWVKRNKTAIATFAIGVAISKGWIAAENGKNFLSIFGLG